MPNAPKTHGQLMRERGLVAPKRDTRQLSAAQRGYNGQWQRAREVFLRHNPLCLYCRRQGRESLAGIVDHNPPHQGDMIKFWNVKSWTPCCPECHTLVTHAFDGGDGGPVKPREGAYVAPAEGETDI